MSDLTLLVTLLAFAFGKGLPCTAKQRLASDGGYGSAPACHSNS